MNIDELKAYWDEQAKRPAPAPSPLKVGLVEGQHQMSVDRYLLPADITAQVGYGQGLADATREAVDGLFQSFFEVKIDLYLTGLVGAAVVAAAAVERLKEYGIHHAYYWNPVAETYERITFGGAE